MTTSNKNLASITERIDFACGCKAVCTGKVMWSMVFCKGHGSKAVSTDPNLLSSEELWNELHTRFDACVLITTKPGKKNDTDVRRLLTSGSINSASGLLNYGRLLVDHLIVEMAVRDENDELHLTC